jgi:IS1 family transposase
LYAEVKAVNRLKVEKQETAIRALAEGASIRSVERMTGIHRDTIMRLGLRVGATCEQIMDETMHDLTCERIEVDEVWSFIGKKQRHVRYWEDHSQVGDSWVWVALDPDSKVIPAYAVGKRDVPTARAFVADLASRLQNRVQISSDGLWAYVDAIEQAWGADVDYAQIVKTYEADPIGPGRYSPPKVSSVEKTIIQGDPDMRKASTSLVERSNLTLRTFNRRFTRLTCAFSKRPENHRKSVALSLCVYNFVRRHGTLKTTPAVAAGVTYREWTIRDLLEW